MTLELNESIGELAANDAGDASWPSHNQATEFDTVDHFIVRNGVEFAGTHIILDLWGAQQLDDIQHMERTLRKAVQVAGATLLHIHLHHFTPNGGVSGVAVLAESHISVHTWPERDFAAFDVFMCGDAQPELTIPVLREAFQPSGINISEHLRGTNLPSLEASKLAANDTVAEQVHEQQA